MSTKVHDRSRDMTIQTTSKSVHKKVDVKTGHQHHPDTIVQRARLDPGSLTPSRVRFLQEAIGNNSVTRFIGKIARMAATDPGKTTKQGESGVIQRDFDSDLAMLTAQRDNAPADSLYRNILAEAINSAARVRAWASVVASGNAERRFTTDGDVDGYILKYQADAIDATERIANFVHELTHISVQTAYDSDFVNYANPPKRAVEEPQYGELVDNPEFGKAVKGMRNEEKRQADRMNDKAITILDGNLQALDKLVASSSLTQERQNQIREKIMYGRQNPHKEYDTVVNQIYLWCKGWDADNNTRFSRVLEAMVEDAYNRRRNQAAVEKKVPVPQKGCYITTACMTARGLPDDCEELTALRAFRDGYLVTRANGWSLIELYYRYAPLIVEEIDEREDALTIYDQLYNVIRTCVDAIGRGDDEFAYTTYCDMVVRLMEEYVSDAVEEASIVTVIP